MEAAQPARYVLMTVMCSECNEKQRVHVTASTGFSHTKEQEVKCLKCGKSFLTRVPARIIAGPFPLA
jgi:ribosomal protein S27E